MKNPLEIIKEEQEHLARMKEILNTPYPNTEKFECNENEFDHWFMGKVLYPLCSLILYITKHRFDVPSKEELERCSFPRLTSEEIFDIIVTMLPVKIRQVMNILDCSSKALDVLIEATKENDKSKFIAALHSERIDTFYISQLCSLYQNQIDSMEQLKYILNNYLFTEKIDDATFENSISIVEYMQSITRKTKASLDPDNKIDFLELSDRYYQASGMQKEKEVFRNFWLILCAFCLNHTKEVEVIVDYFNQHPLLQKWDKELGNEYFSEGAEYKECPKELRLPMADAIWEDELRQISKEYPCLANQNLAYFFGYGEWDNASTPHIIWHGEYGELAYFLRVLYTGQVNKGKIDCTKHPMPKGVWETATKIFINDKGKNAQCSTFTSAQPNKYINSVSRVMLKVLTNVGR